MNVARNKQTGMTLLEVILSLGILASLMMAVSMLLKNSSEMKEGISQAGNVNHRLQFAISKLSNDLAHAFMVQKTDLDRRTKALFLIEKQGESDKLSLTTFTHRAKKLHSKEADMTYIVYEVKRSEEGGIHLYRGEAARIPESFHAAPPMVLLTKSIKSLRIVPWDGERWVRERWDSRQRAYRNKIPYMVRIELAAYEEEEVTTNDNLEEMTTVSLKTVAFNHFATNFEQVKTITAPIRWY